MTPETVLLPSLEVDAIRELAGRDQWVTWRFEARGGEPTKVPYTPTWRPASSTNASTWSTFERCFAAAAKDRFDGVGYVFSETDPYVGIDLDDCLHEDGTLEPWADEIVCEFDTYAEVSPSGAGLKLFCRGTLPPGRRRTGKVEMYDRARFFTVTGRLWGERETIEERTDALTQLHSRTFGDQAELERVTYQGQPFDGTLSKRVELVLCDARIRARFERDATGLRDESPSGVDFALASLLAHRGLEGAEIETAARCSRAKDSSARQKGDDYFTRTVEKALAAARSDAEGELTSEVPAMAEHSSGNGESPPEDWAESVPAEWGEPVAIGSGSTREKEPKPDPKPPVRLRLLTEEEFETDLAPEYVIEGLLYQSSTTLFTGASKAGKTWAALQAGMSVIAGLPFLGLETRPARVLLCSLELGAGMVRQRLNAISHDLGLPRPTIGEGLHVLAPTASYLPHLDLSRDEGCALLRGAIEETGCQLVILDTLYRFIPGTDPNDNGEMGDVMGRLNDLAQGTGAALLILDHVGKGEQSGPVSHSALGASVKGGAARVVAALKRTSKDDGGRWEINVESHFGSWDEPIFYERPKSEDGSRGKGCALCTASEARGLPLERVRNLFHRFGEQIESGDPPKLRRTFTSKRKLVDGLKAASLATGNADGEAMVDAILKDYCAPERAGWRGADRPIRTSGGPNRAVIFRWAGTMEEDSLDA